ncbi:MAG TPA: DUF3426 domain-containing protein [Candidatus Dormibacteraeota bacterium]
MIITCPNCRTGYQIKPLTLGQHGRTVRCTSCGHRWFVRPEGVGKPEAVPPPIPPAPPEPVTEPPPEPVPLANAPPTPAGGEAPARRGGLVGWLLLALVALLLAAAVFGRDQLVSAVPALLPVYQRLGLPVTLHEGLEFAELASARRDSGGAQAVAVSGQVRNTSDHELPVPRLRVALLDDRHHELRSQIFDPPQPTLPPGGTVRFELALPDPPAEARDFTIAFGDPS